MPTQYRLFCVLGDHYRFFTRWFQISVSDDDVVAEHIDFCALNGMLYDIEVK